MNNPTADAFFRMDSPAPYFPVLMADRFIGVCAGSLGGRYPLVQICTGPAHGAVNAVTLHREDATRLYEQLGAVLAAEAV